NGFSRIDESLRKKNMRTRERGVAAEIDFHLGGHPPQIEPVGAASAEKGGLREVHFGGDRLHPRVVARAIEYADRGGITTKGFRRKSIDLKNANGHERRNS